MTSDPDSIPGPAAGLDAWLTSYGRIHDDHVRTAGGDLVVLGLTDGDGSRFIGASLAAESPVGQWPTTWGGWTRMYFRAIVSTGASVLVEARHLVHDHECSSTTCIALRRRHRDFVRARPGVEYLRVCSAVSGNDDYARGVLVDREQYEHEETIPGRVMSADDFDQSWRSYESVACLRPQPDLFA